MYQFYAHGLLRLFEELRDLEIEITKPCDHALSPQEQAALNKRVANHYVVARALSAKMQFSSSEKQIRRMFDATVNKQVSGTDLAAMLTELRLRIREDMEDHVYLWIPEKEASRAFNKGEKGYQPKVPAELMDASIVARFPSASDDIDAAFRCFVFDCYPASMFHLMRVVEIGVRELAVASLLDDAKPSWGAILQHVEKLVLRTKFEELDPRVKRHRLMLENLLPQMQAIQRAWRNKFTHVGTKIIPAESITGPIAFEILVAVEAFVRQLASDLPPAVAW